jgi:hypothetical protein
VGNVETDTQAAYAMFVDEVPAIRAAAQWLLAAAGAIGAVLVAGLQLGGLGRLSDRPWALVIGVLAFGVAIWMIGWAIRAASRVLVIGRVTVSNLLMVDAKRQASAEGVHVDVLEGEQLLGGILDQIGVNRGWLLPSGCSSLTDLYTKYQEALATEGAEELVEELRGRLAEVTAFARTESARHFYQDLTSGLTGFRGRLLAGAIATLVIVVGWAPADSEPKVTVPTPVQVFITGSISEMRAAGLAGSCPRGSTLSGVAIAGTLLEPVVVSAGTKTCPPSRFTVTSTLGIAVPVAKP